MEYNIESVPGIGPKKLEELKKQGVKKFDDLYDLKYFSQLSTDSKAFLIYKPALQVSYNFITKVENFFIKHNIKGIIAGSYRRKKKQSKDIDFISFITANKLISIIQKSNAKLFIHSRGDDKIGAILEIFNKRVRIDIWFPKKDERVFYLFYTTGNATFNIITRQIAKKKGYLLNRHGIFYSGKYPTRRVKNIKTEKDILQLLGKKYLKPEERNY